MTYDEGKVYLRDVRNGNIYPYERYLAADRNFEPTIPNPVSGSMPKLDLDELNKIEAELTQTEAELAHLKQEAPSN